ncbi:uncharacterized protein LOC132262058 [Phlebotomus argentipes]|uniref:uncharacterized protein LOC132262058 n=1 Tax=Phlebotomus argentipes TaxID=94469 RepID=UPI002892E4E2|nr:uncharacterized protein LOC132262058 [Phlebotomus argentipes]
MFLAKVTIILLFCTLDVLARSQAHDHGVFFSDSAELEFHEEEGARKSLNRLKAILLKQELPFDSQISDALRDDELPKRFKVLHSHCPHGQLMDHRGKCRQVW